VAGKNPATVFSNIFSDADSSKISSILFTCSDEVDMALDLHWDSDRRRIRARSHSF
jgi:hypothetical protein